MLQTLEKASVLHSFIHPSSLLHLPISIYLVNDLEGFEQPGSLTPVEIHSFIHQRFVQHLLGAKCEGHVH